ncbi:MAG: DUF4160 domain-containing protein [Sphingosinicella sp.]
MVTVHRAFGYRFVIYTNDHAPAHLHLVGAGGEAKVEIADETRLVWNVGIGKADLRRLLREVGDRRETLLEEWNRLHG